MLLLLYPIIWIGGCVILYHCTDWDILTISFAFIILFITILFGLITLFMRFEMRDSSICSSAIWTFRKKKKKKHFILFNSLVWVLELSTLQISLYHFLTFFFPLIFNHSWLKSCEKNNNYCTGCDWRLNLKQGLTEL